jgi:hypothetical protein
MVANRYANEKTQPVKVYPISWTGLVWYQVRVPPDFQGLPFDPFRTRSYLTLLF